jgi:hypothetical protein
MTAEAGLISCCCGSPPAPPGCCPCITASRTITWSGNVRIFAGNPICLQYLLTAPPCEGLNSEPPPTIYYDRVLKDDLVLQSMPISVPRNGIQCAYQTRFSPAVPYVVSSHAYRRFFSDNQFGWRCQASLFNDPEWPTLEESFGLSVAFRLIPFKRSLQSCPGVQASKWEIVILAGPVSLTFRSDQQTCNPTSWYLHDLATTISPYYDFAFSSGCLQALSSPCLNTAYCQQSASNRCITGGASCVAYLGGSVNGAHSGILVEPGTVSLNAI